MGSTERGDEVASNCVLVLMSSARIEGLALFEAITGVCATVDGLSETKTEEDGPVDGQRTDGVLCALVCRTASHTALTQPARPLTDVAANFSRAFPSKSSSNTFGSLNSGSSGNMLASVGSRSQRASERTSVHWDSWTSDVEGFPSAENHVKTTCVR